jgi:ribonuclease P/MRP protein subunit POP3
LNPPPPALSSFIVVGLNRIIRSLESSSQKIGPGQAEQVLGDSFQGLTDGLLDENIAPDQSSNPHFTAILVLRSSQPTILHAHLPQLISIASLAHPESPPTRLVQLPKGCDERLCEILGLPRVSFIGIVEGAPNSQGLVDFIRDSVAPIELPWLSDVKNAKYLPVNVKAIETTVGISKKVQLSKHQS